MTNEQCRHLIIERYPQSSDDYQCQQCLEPFVVRPAADQKAESDVEEALKVLEQTLLEVAHAQRSGAEWYTKGHNGLYQQVSMWVGRGSEAIKKARAAFEQLRKENADLIHDNEQIMDALNAEVNAREPDALRKYGQHLPLCAALATDGPNAPYPCSCGLDAALGDEKATVEPSGEQTNCPRCEAPFFVAENGCQCCGHK